GRDDWGRLYRRGERRRRVGRDRRGRLVGGRVGRTDPEEVGRARREPRERDRVRGHKGRIVGGQVERPGRGPVVHARARGLVRRPGDRGRGPVGARSRVHGGDRRRGRVRVGRGERRRRVGRDRRGRLVGGRVGRTDPEEVGRA